MGKTIFIDEGIQDLVRAFNQIKGVETWTSCDGHSLGSAWLAFICSEELATALMKLVLRYKGIEFKIQNRRRNNGLVHMMELYPIWAGKNLGQMQAELIKTLETDGWLTEECQFEILPRVFNDEKRAQQNIDFSQSRALMTTEKFELLKSYLYDKWSQRLDVFKAQMQPTIPHRHFATYFGELPRLHGNECCGFFCNEILKISSKPPRREWQSWNIKWQGYRIIISLGFRDAYSRFECIHVVTCLQDLGEKRFEDDNVIRALLSP